MVKKYPKVYIFMLIRLRFFTKKWAENFKKGVNMEVLIFIAGAIIGSLLAILVIRRWYIGVLHIVQTHLESAPQPLLDLDKPFDSFMKKNKYVLYA